MIGYKTVDLRAAMYARLSREDGDKMESDSIRNQRDLIHDYARRESITIVDEFVDDGYSGTNYERPAFQRLLKECQSKRINCIIVKDLSRLGRNYIETGNYLERVFPLLGIRFIAINDHYDTASQTGDSDSIIIPFKNLINDAYCRDISVKIRSQLDVKRKNGKFIGSFASYGYMKDPKDKNHLVIDEVAAETVRIIYGLRLNGYSMNAIADQLDAMKILPPMEYKHNKGLNYNGGFRAGIQPHWSHIAVRRILSDEVYIGNMAQGKYQKINYKLKHIRTVDEKEWIKVEGTHEAIVPKEVYALVQELGERDMRPTSDKTIDPLAGSVWCADCGQNMIRRISQGGKHGELFRYYHCSTAKRGEGCKAHLIRIDQTHQAVLQAIKAQIKVIDHAEMILQKIADLPKESIRVRTTATQIEELKKEVERYRGLKVRAYQDSVENMISEDEYREISARFTAKLHAAEKALAACEERRRKFLAGDYQLKPWMREFQRYREVNELDRAMVTALIQSIEVHEKQRIEIHFRFEDELTSFLELSAEYENILKGVPA